MTPSERQKEIACAFAMYFQHGDAYKNYDRWLLTEEGKRLTAEEPEPKAEKGDKGGECNRTHCKNPDADFYNHSTRMYYCAECAVLLNDANRADAMRIYGHELCTLEEAKSPESSYDLLVKISGQLDRIEGRMKFEPKE